MKKTFFSTHDRGENRLNNASAPHNTTTEDATFTFFAFGHF